MIKMITKKIFVCDMCGHEYEALIGDSVPKDVFEFTVNLADGAKNIQICPACQAKLKYALKEKSNGIYGFESCGCGYSKKEEKEDD